MNARGSLLRTTALAGILALVLSQGATAQGAYFTFDIPAESLTSALQEVAKTSGKQIVFSDKLTSGKVTTGLHGSFTVDAALDKLLIGTDLMASEATSGGIIVKSKNVQAASSEAAFSGTGSPEMVVVTGTRIVGAPQEGPQPVNHYAAVDIQKSGQTTVADFLNTLPDVSVNSVSNSFASFGGQTTVRLHGLPVGTTLVLIDGHRVELSGINSSGNSIFDLNTIPVAAIDRIDVLPVGSSAIYGSDAIGGVVNVVLKTKMDGLQVSSTVDHANGYDKFDESAAWGGTWGPASILAVGSFETNNGLTGNDRSLTANDNFTRFATMGGHDVRQTYCDPGTVYSTTSANLPGLTATSAGIPPGIIGVPSVQQFSANAGQPNLCSYYSRNSIVPASQKYGLMVNGDYQLTSGVDLFAELMYSRVSVNQQLSGPPITKQLVPATNPFNPFGTPVGVSYEFATLEGANVVGTDFMRAMVGARGDLFGNWKWEVSAWQAQDRENYAKPDQLNSSALANALASTNASTSVNLFASGPPASPDVLQSIFYTVNNKYLGSTQAVSAYSTGPLFLLPAGTLDVAIGGEYDRNKLTSVVTSGSTSTAANLHRDQYALFVESRVPILPNREDLKSPDMLALTLADRYDSYDDFGGTFNPQFGVEFRPTTGLLVRASYAESFKAPGLVQLYNPISTVNTQVVDPQKGNATVLTKATTGGNANLQPETGLSKSLGVVWDSVEVPNLTASLTWWAISENNRITTPAPQTIVSNPTLFPTRATRGPDGSITLINSTSANFGSLNTQGVDLGINYKFDTDIGTFSEGLYVSEIYKYLAALIPGSTPVDRLSAATTSDAWAPRYKATLNIGWSTGPYSLSVSGRYTGEYRDYQDIANTNKLGNFTLWDLHGRYDLGTALVPEDDVLRGTYIEAGAINVFDTLPRYSNAGFGDVGYDYLEYDILGRQVYLTLGLRL